MKNLVVFVSPRKKFYGEFAILVRVLIDNSVDLGWKSDDMMLVTNFNFAYNGIKTIVVGDEYFQGDPRSIKTSILPSMIKDGLIVKGEIYWNHDLDAFQLSSINETELGLNGVDIGLTDYGWQSRWCMGSYFFKEGAKDIFDLIYPLMFPNITDEHAMFQLGDKINGRHKRLNITYNFGMRKVEENYMRADKPLKVVHFHPTYKRSRTWDVFVLGKNGLSMPLVDERLIGLFRHHGIR